MIGAHDPRAAAALDLAMKGLSPRARHHRRRRMGEASRQAARQAVAAGVVVISRLDHPRGLRGPEPDVVTVNVARREISRWGQTIGGLGPVSFRYLAAIITRAGQPLRMSELIDAVWGDDRNGGPMSPRDSICHYDTRFGPALALMGVDLVAKNGTREARIMSAPLPVGSV